MDPTTPQKSTRSNVSHETPVVKKHTAETRYLHGSTGAARQAVVQDIGGYIPEVDVEVFFETVCPPLHPDISIDKVVKRLKKSGEIKNNRWDRFSKDPSSHTTNENETFGKLAPLAEAIVKASEVDNPTATFVNNPDETPVSYWKNSQSRPDAYLTLRHPSKDEKSHWKHIALSAEFKKRNKPKERDDDVEKVIWGMHHCMREDPRRRFTFGMTVEDTSMRMWYTNRAEIFVTKPFNFITEHEILVRLLLSFCFASKTSLGWDPTMELGMDPQSKHPAYIITVRGKDGKVKKYRTIQLLADIGANALRGRGTRVWLVVEIDADGKVIGDPVVLKDCWIDADRTREGDIMKEVRDETDKELHKHLLTVVHHGDVYIQRADSDSGHKEEADNTRTVMTRGEDVMENASEFKVKLLPEDGIKAEPAEDARTADRGDHRSPQEHSNRAEGEPTMYRYDPKTHYRIVFEQVCEPLYLQTDLATIFRSLGEILSALSYLHAAGWVHRDISAGNIMIHQGVAILGDFEYAKRMNAASAHEIRTGTADFMAIEVDEMSYAFMPRHCRNARAILAELQEGMPSPTVSPDVFPPFRYNPLHDMESVWWLTVYFLVARRLVSVGGKSVVYKFAEQRHHAHKLFYTLTERKSVVKDEGRYQRIARSLPQKHYAHFANILDALRLALIQLYEEAEMNVESIDRTAARSIGNEYSQIYFGLSQIIIRQGGMVIGDFEARNKDEKPSRTPTQVGAPLHSQPESGATLEEETADEKTVQSLQSKMGGLAVTVPVADQPVLKYGPKRVKHSFGPVPDMLRSHPMTTRSQIKKADKSG